MTSILIFFVAALAIAAVVAFIRGLMAFLGEGELLKNGTPESDLRRGIQQNRMMAQRVLFQGLAVFVLALLGAVAAQK